MAEENKTEVKPANIKKTLQAQLVKAVKTGDFKKAARLRLSLKNSK